MNNLNESQKAELEDKIREAVPESMRHICYRCSSILEYKDCNWINPIIDHCPQSDKGDMCEPVVGSPKKRKLNLQDVLIALGEVTSKHQDWYYFDTSGNLLIHGWHQTRVNSSPEEVFYNLTKNYHEQEEEFYIFLYQLLINE